MARPMPPWSLECRMAWACYGTAGCQDEWLREGIWWEPQRGAMVQQKGSGMKTRRILPFTPRVTVRDDSSGK